MAKAKYTKDPAGYFKTMVWDGTFDEHGRKHRICLRSRKSSADLESKVKALKLQIDAGTALMSTDKTVEEYSKDWIQTKAVLSRNTQRQYKDILKYYIIPAMGAVPLRQISRLHLQSLIAANADHPRTCQLIRRTFIQMTESAILDRYVPEAVLRPCKAVKLPAYYRKERRILTDAEKKAIKTADLTPMQRCFVLLLYGCGLRRGEALALTPADIDLNRSTVRICRAVEFIGNSSGIKPPKSRNGFRTLPLPGFLADFLRDYLPTVPGDYLIHKADGSLMTQSAFRRMWEQILDALNTAAGGTKKIRVITGLTPHIFRHTYCTELCYQVPSITTKKVAQLLGDDEAMVLEIYSHIVEDKEDAPGAIQRAIVL